MRKFKAEIIFTRHLWKIFRSRHEVSDKYVGTVTHSLLMGLKLLAGNLIIRVKRNWRFYRHDWKRFKIISFFLVCSVQFSQIVPPPFSEYNGSEWHQLPIWLLFDILKCVAFLWPKTIPHKNGKIHRSVKKHIFAHAKVSACFKTKKIKKLRKRVCRRIVCLLGIGNEEKRTT